MVMVNRRRNVCRRGAVTAEIALLLPIILLVTFGVIRYAWFFRMHLYVTNAARFGSRVAIRADATTDNVYDAISALLGANGAKIIEGPVQSSPVSVTLRVNGTVVTDIAGTVLGDAITVRIEVPAGEVDIMPMAPFTILDPDPFSLKASVTMAKEGA